MPPVTELLTMREKQMLEWATGLQNENWEVAGHFIKIKNTTHAMYGFLKN